MGSANGLMMPSEDGETEEPIIADEEHIEEAFDAESNGLEMLPDEMRISRMWSTWLLRAVAAVSAAETILRAAAEAAAPAGTERPRPLVVHMSFLPASPAALLAALALLLAVCACDDGPWAALLCNVGLTVSTPRVICRLSG